MKRRTMPLLLTICLLLLTALPQSIFAAQTLPGNSKPASLDEFLEYMQWYNDGQGGKEYNAAEAATDPSNIMENIVRNGSVAALYKYPYSASNEDYWGQADPKGHWPSYGRISRQNANWAAKNIFNISDSDIDTLVSRAESKDSFYRDGDFYLFPLYGVGGPGYELTYHLVRQEGSRYYIIYTASIEGSPEFDNTFFAEMERKTIDGDAWWSIHRHSALIPQDMPGTPFIDVSENDYFGPAVEWAVDKGVTAGTGVMTFDPYVPCSRGQMVTFLWRAAGAPVVSSPSTRFADVPDGQYYSDAVYWAKETGITAGTSATTFSPYEYVTRGQVVTFLWRIAGSPAFTGQKDQFTDVASDAYYADAVYWALHTGLTQGMSPSTFEPETFCTRGQIVTFLYRSK